MMTGRKRMMSKIHSGWWITLLVLIMMPICGCGDGKGTLGSPGATGTTGSVLTIDSILGDGDLGLNVDGIQNDCDGEPEEYTDHLVTVTLRNSSRPNEGDTKTDTTVTDIAIEYYTVEYRRPNGETGPAPTFTTLTYYHSFVVPANGSIGLSITLFDLENKRQYWNWVLNREGENFQDPIRYTAIITFYGQTIYGDDVSIAGSVNFTITNFNNC